MEIWRIVYKHVRDQDWKPLSTAKRIYLTKGAATGVMKMHGRLSNENWDDQEKMWVAPGGSIVYRIQCASVDWENYGSN